MKQIHEYLICAGGVAADAVATAPREVDTAANIVIVGDDLSPPYQRPSLSKALCKSDK